jgi:hypothetical protein
VVWVVTVYLLLLLALQSLAQVVEAVDRPLLKALGVLAAEALVDIKILLACLQQTEL